MKEASPSKEEVLSTTYLRRLLTSLCSRLSSRTPVGPSPPLSFPVVLLRPLTVGSSVQQANSIGETGHAVSGPGTYVPDGATSGHGYLVRSPTVRPAPAHQRSASFTALIANLGPLQSSTPFCLLILVVAYPSAAVNDPVPETSSEGHDILTLIW